MKIQRPNHPSFALPLRRALLAAIAALSLAAVPASQAWTVRILTPENLNAFGMPPETLFPMFQMFQRVEANGAVIAYSALADFEVGVTEADSLFIVFPYDGQQGRDYTEAEVTALSSIFTTDMRIVLAHEQNSDGGGDGNYNRVVAGLLGGTLGDNLPDIGSQTVIANAHGLMDGVSALGCWYAGSMTGGYSLTSGATISLWGDDLNILLMMDGTIALNDLAQTDRGAGDNERFTMNVADFLCGTTPPSVPEPAAWAALTGLAMLAVAVIRRRIRS